MYYKLLAYKEIKDNAYLYDAISDSYIKEWIKSNFEWYTTKAVKNKYRYMFLSSMTIIYPLIAEVALNISIDGIEGRSVSSIALACSVAAASFLTLTDSRRKWGMYRDQAETIKNEMIKFASDLYDEELIYRDMKGEQRLVQNILSSGVKTHEKWKEPFDRKDQDTV